MINKYQNLIAKCIAQNVQFTKWDTEKNYFRFHNSHYDWWAFPLNQPSSFGNLYQVKDQDIEIFKNNAQFISALRSNGVLVSRAWGYDLVEGKPLENVAPEQKWQNWPIRLYKISKSLELFGQNDLHGHSVKYGISLIQGGNNFFYKHDLSKYFNRFRNSKKQHF